MTITRPRSAILGEVAGRSTGRRTLALVVAVLFGAAAGLTAGCAGTGGTGADAGLGVGSGAPAGAASSDAMASTNPSVRPNSPVDNTATAIEVAEQVYEGNDIVEILWLTYDGHQGELDETEGKNPEIEAINRDIEQALGLPWETGEEGKLDWVDRMIDIRSYPFTSEDYLQIVTTSVAYPNNGSVGALFSWVFDRRANAWIQPQDVYAEAGLSGPALLDAVATAFTESGNSGSVNDVEASGFVYVHGVDEWTPQFLVTATGVDEADAEWNAFFSYQPASPGGTDGPALTRLNRDLLFEPEAPDVMDPPLMYGGPVADSGMWIDLPPGAQAEQTGSGTDESGNGWAEYIAADGALVVSIRRVAAEATLDSDDMAGQVLDGAPDGDPATWQLDEEESQRVAVEYGYPVAVYRFDSGTKKDLRHHVGVYVPSGAGGYVADFSIMTDLWDQTYPLAREWMAGLNLEDIPL